MRIIQSELADYPQRDLFTGEEPQFFNTIELKGPALVKAKEAVKHQEEVILAAFQRNPVASMTAEDALRLLSEGTPITSARRALTNLCEAGRLTKIPLTEKLTMGSMGKPIHSWRLAVLYPPIEEVLGGPID